MDFAKPAWLESGMDCDVVISSRVRIARNLRDTPFPNRLSDSERASVVRRVVEQSPGLIPVWLPDLSPDQRDLLAAVRLAPVSFAARQEGCLLADGRLALSVLINEEDHIRIQAILPGSLLEGASEMAAAIEQRISQNLPLAWNNEYGYLTASPANAGSGVRASSLCHLIGLAARRRLVRWLNAASDAGVVMRGVYGEGSRAVGGFFQLSVVGTRTESCQVAAGRLLAIGRLLVQAEREARDALGREWADKMSGECAEFVAEADGVTLGESLRVLGWWRLAAALRSEDAARHVDAWSAEILIDKWRQQADADARRAAALRRHVGGTIG